MKSQKFKVLIITLLILTGTAITAFLYNENLSSNESNASNSIISGKISYEDISGQKLFILNTLSGQRYWIWGDIKLDQNNIGKNYSAYGSIQNNSYYAQDKINKIIKLTKLVPIPFKYSTGGINYIVFDLDNYVTNKSENLLYSPDNQNKGIKTAIGSYDKNPSQIKADLQYFCDYGHNKIGTMLWFAPFTSNMTQDVTYGWMINSKGGKLTARNEKNIKNYLSLLSAIKDSSGQRCFNEIQFRFAPLSTASSIGWSTWNEKQYLENRQFIYYTRSIVKESLENTGIKLIFDLGAEEGGRTEGQVSNYTKRLWSDYTSKYGSDDTYGFSVAIYNSRIVNLFSMYDQVGKRPKMIALDIYPQSISQWINTFRQISSELIQSKAIATPIIIQETFADTNTERIFELAKSQNIDVYTIMYWQNIRSKLYDNEGNINHFSSIRYKYQ